MPTNPDDVRAIAALDEPARRSLYEWVAAAGRPVGRDEAAEAVGVSRALAAFHLDRLVRDGLLVPSTGGCPAGPAGPGRPAKLYRRAPRTVAVSLPDRRYETAAKLFAETLERLGHGRTRARPTSCGPPPGRSGSQPALPGRPRPASRESGRPEGGAAPDAPRPRATSRSPMTRETSASATARTMRLSTTTDRSSAA